jgi:hypothetical protein
MSYVSGLLSMAMLQYVRVKNMIHLNDRRIISGSFTEGTLTGIQLVADISATSPHHFLVFCHIFATFWRKIKVDSVLES